MGVTWIWIGRDPNPGTGCFILVAKREPSPRAVSSSVSGFTAGKGNLAEVVAPESDESSKMGAARFIARVARNNEYGRKSGWEYRLPLGRLLHGTRRAENDSADHGLSRSLRAEQPLRFRGKPS